LPDDFEISTVNNYTKKVASEFNKNKLIWLDKQGYLARTHAQSYTY